MNFRPYLAFAGNCREAFTAYKEIFGGELTLMTMGDAPADSGVMAPDAPRDAIMHAALTFGSESLMGADDPSGNFDGKVHGMCVTCTLSDPAEARKIFDALAEGGQVQMPLGETFFSAAFGMCIDRFGIPWMIDAAAPAHT